MNLDYRRAQPDDAPTCVVLRGKTRENAVSVERLGSIGITAESWANDIQSGALPGHICTVDGTMIGYCFGAPASGEIVVLALLPEYESRGVGRELLARMVRQLLASGHQRLFLGCSADPTSRSHGFYRHLGWVSTGKIDKHGDEILEYITSTTSLPAVAQADHCA